MVVIRFARRGVKKKPFYHVVVTDERQRRDSGRIIEKLGFVNPVARGEEIRVHLEKERIDHWLSQGAKPSLAVIRAMKAYAAANGPVPAKIQSIRQLSKAHLEKIQLNVQDYRQVKEEAATTKAGEASKKEKKAGKTRAKSADVTKSTAKATTSSPEKKEAKVEQSASAESQKSQAVQSETKQPSTEDSPNPTNKDSQTSDE